MICLSLLSIGVYIPSNESRLKVSFLYCMLGSMVCLVFTKSLVVAALAASFAASWKMEWRRRPDISYSPSGRLLWLSVIGCLYIGKGHRLQNGCVKTHNQGTSEHFFSQQELHP